MLKLATSLVLNAIKIMGITKVKSVLLLPCATGMAMTLALLTFKSMKPDGKYVLFSRIDQKTCLKCIVTSGLIPIIINPIPDPSTSEVLKVFI
jgi:O-phospho-L-seryl-tRNASec:L-selenocysteinyl-tRNA synthase